MSSHDIRDTKRPAPDQVLVDIADYVMDYDVTQSREAMETARYCYPACTKVLGPVVPGASMTNGVKVPGTSYELDPVQAAFNIGAMIRWLDFNDTWLAAEWGHPSDNLGGILAVADYLSRQAVAAGKPALTLKQVLAAMVKAHEIQGVIALENGFNRVGLDHVMLVRIATAAVVTQMLGGTRQEVIDAVSHAWIDGSALRTYRHAPNTGSRKSWAAGDATSRGVRLALMVLRGEMGYPSALTVKTWGFNDVLYKGNALKFTQSYASYVMENILFKISFPAEFHSQTACEAAVTLHPQVVGKFDQIEKIVIETQESGVRIIDKTGPLNNPADRDHCIQYMVAVPLITGHLTAEDYEDNVAANPLIDALRNKMTVVENPQFTVDYLDASKRSIGNSVQVFFKDGSSTDKVSVEYPIGHRRRRAEGIPVLQAKFARNLATRLSPKKSAQILALCAEQTTLENTLVHEFMDLLAL